MDYSLAHGQDLPAHMEFSPPEQHTRLPTRVREDPVVHGYNPCIERICLCGGWPGPAPIRLKCEVCQRKATLEAERL